MKKCVLFCFSLFVLSSGLPSCGINDMSGDKLRVEAGVSLPLGSIVISDSMLFALAGDFAKQLVVDPQTHVLNVYMRDSLQLINEEYFNSIFEFGTQYCQFSIPYQDVEIDDDALYDIPAGIQQTVSLTMPGNERIDETIFASGNVTMTLDNPNDKDLSQIRVAIEQFVHKTTGEPLVITLGSPVPITTDYVLRPINTDQMLNGLTFIFSGKAPLLSQFSGRVSITLNGLQSAKGFFGRKVITTPTIVLSVTPEFVEFADMIDYLYFNSPRLVFDVRNQYNAPVIVSLDKLLISETRLNLKSGYDKFFIPAQSSVKYIVDNQSTQNGKQLSELIGTQFRSFTVNANAILNPTLNDVNQLSEPPIGYQEPTYNSFSITDSVFGNYTVTLPFDLVMRDARLDQKIDIDLSGIQNDNSRIEEFSFGFTAVNYMPLDVNVNAYVMSLNAEKVYLFEQPITIQSSVSKNQFEAVPYIIEGPAMLIAKIKEDKLNDMFKSKELYFELSVSTKDALTNESVQIFSPSWISMKVLAGAKLDLALTGQGLAPQGRVVQL